MYLNSLLKNLREAVIFLSPEETIDEISPLVKSYFSWNITEIKGKTFKNLFQDEHLTKPFSFIEYMRMKDEGDLIESLVYSNNQKIYLSWSAVPLDTALGWMLIGRDVSNLKKLEIHQHTLYAQLEKISACVPGNFYWKNTEAQYLGCNDILLKTLGLSSMKDIIGKTDKDLWPAQADSLRENDQRVIQTGETLFLEEKVTTGQTDRYFTVIKMPLLDEEGKIIGILGNSLDITELKNTQAALQIAIEKAEAASRVKSEFIANIGHDIRTPLTGIIGFSHHLKDHISDAQDKECAKQIHDSGEQLLGLLNSVLDMITADSVNEDNVIKEVFDLHNLIQDVINLELPAIHEHNLTIKTHIEETVPHYVIGDKMKLHRILLNLTGNAMKFTKQGHVEIHASSIVQKKDTVTIKFKVTDTGIGIPEELQDKVFDRFFKISPSHKGTYSGNGIGLHIAQKYVELLGGDLRLESKEGIGTSFFFSLEMKLGEKNFNKKILEPESTTNLPSPIKRLKADQFHVLLVEDNNPALQVLKMMVEPYVTHLKIASDAETAFELVQNNAFDLIISDIGLPKKNGDELARDIRAYENKHNRAPSFIAALTGHAVNEIAENCIMAGMNEVYRKPMDTETLRALMERFKPLPHSAPSNPQIEESMERSNAVSQTVIDDKQQYLADLPLNADDLFDLSKYHILDVPDALKYVGSEEVLVDILKVLKDESVPNDLNIMKLAYKAHDYEKVQQLAHKIKSGAIYVGTERMKMACQYLERYWKSGQRDLFEKLYQQVIITIDQTLDSIEDWLLNK